MSESHQVLFIRKSDRYRPHERIRGIGGRNRNGSSWYLPQEQAIDGIERGQWSFMVSFAARGGPALDVVVATDPQGYKYLKTPADGGQPNTLLSLPEC